MGMISHLEMLELRSVSGCLLVPDLLTFIGGLGFLLSLSFVFAEEEDFFIRR